MGDDLKTRIVKMLILSVFFLCAGIAMLSVVLSLPGQPSLENAKSACHSMGGQYGNIEGHQICSKAVELK